MKKLRLAAVLLSVCVAFAVPAMAKEESRALLLTGTVECLEVEAIKAPFSGAIKPFSLRAGDKVSTGDTLFEVETKTLYAPMAGTVGAVYAGDGDTASIVTQRYGALLAIDPVNRFIVQCNTRTGYDSANTRDVRVGTPVWLKTAEGDKRTGEGWIISVSGSTFTVEVTGGDLLFDDNVYVYNNAEMLNKQKLARGLVSAVAPVNVSGTGTVIKTMVSRGDTVKAGDPLLSYIPDELADGVPSGEIKAVKNGVVQSVQITQGAQASKDQVLAYVLLTDRMTLIGQVDEGDLGRIAVGDAATVTFEELSLEPVAATVRSISNLAAQGETASYEVVFDFDCPAGVAQGMHATITVE